METVYKDIQNIQTKKYTEDREYIYRRHYKAIKEFFQLFTKLTTIPTLVHLVDECNILISDIDHYLLKCQAFDFESYLKFLIIFKEILKYKDISEELSNLLEYLHL